MKCLLHDHGVNPDLQAPTTFDHSLPYKPSSGEELFLAAPTAHAILMIANGFKHLALVDDRPWLK